MRRQFWIYALFVMLSAYAVLAQTSGTIVGNVRDASGAQIEGATVIVTNIDRGTSQTAISGTDGDYVVPFLPAGSYRVSVTKQGFQRQDSPPAQVDVDQRARFDFALGVGSVMQTVEVSSGAPLIESETAELGTVINKSSVQSLPLNGRNFAQLVYLVPGVTTGQQGENLSGSSTINPRAASNFNALGAQANSSGWLVDGIMNNEFTYNTVIIQPSVESIQEFKVLTGTYSAEYGRGSGIVTTQTRSGTNAFHGEAFEFLRNAYLDARSYFNTKPLPKPPYNRNQFGAAIGGPIWRNKTFFFMDYYGETQIQGSTFKTTVPTALERTGNFSELGTTIYNPYSTTVSAGGAVSRTPFAGNIIPKSMLNPVGMTVANIYPLPNGAGLVGNRIDTLKSNLGDNGGNVRIDNRFSDKDSIFGRYSYERFSQFATNGQGGCCLQTPPGLQQQYSLGSYISGGQNTLLHTQGLALNETHVFTPSIVNQFIAGYAHINPFTTQSDYGLNGATGLGFGGINVSQSTSGIPTINIGGAGGGTSYTAINDGPAFLPVNTRQTNYQLEDSVSWTKGPHSVKFGYRIVEIKAGMFESKTTRGSLNFQLNLTNNGAGVGGSGLASLEMGLLANGNNAAASRAYQVAIPYLTSFEHGAYVQDDWKVSQRLSLNLGLRWDLFTPYTEKTDRLSNFDLTSLTLTYAGVNGVSRAVGLQTRYRNFGPRLGFAYDLTGNGNTMLRGGFAISYFPLQPGGSLMYPINLPWAINQNSPTIPQYPTAAQLVLDPPLSNIFPAPVAQQPTTTAQLLADNPAINAQSTQNQTPSFQTYNLDVQRQLGPDLLLEVAYAGSHSVHILFCENPQEVQPGPASIPAASRITIPAIASLRNITYCMNTNFSNYNALNVKVTKRLSHGISSLTSYSWSKSLDEGSSAASGSGYVGTPQTITNLQAGYGPSGYNIPHRLVESLTWFLPAGPGRAFLNNKGVIAAVLGGWELDAIGTIASGFPFSLQSMSSCSNGASTCWPDLVGSPKAIHQTYANWYNPAAFAVPCQVQVTDKGACPNGNAAYRYGTSGRGILRGPQTVNFDFSAAKNVPIRDSLAVQFRVDAFDALNHPPMGIPNTTINSSSPGDTSTAILTTQGDNRDLQGSIKITF